jgi:hypothetical protein
MSSNSIYLQDFNDAILKDVDLNQQQPGVWWRATILTAYSPIVHFERYTLVRETPKGRWITQVEDWTEPKAVWKTKGSHFVSTTKRQALGQLLIRKRAHVRHAKRRYEDAEKGKLLVQYLISQLDAKEGAAP